MKRRTRILAAAVGLVALAAFSSACSTSASAGAAAAARYVPQTRDITLTAVPLLVHEQQGTYDWLKTAFAAKGLLADKEVWGFAPSSLTVYDQDTVHVTVVNPGDDPHTFTIDELAVNGAIKGAGSSSVSFSADKVGSFRFYCAIPEHAPYMWGTITVLPDSAG